MTIKAAFIIIALCALSFWVGVQSSTAIGQHALGMASLFQAVFWGLVAVCILIMACITLLMPNRVMRAFEPGPVRRGSRPRLIWSK